MSELRLLGKGGDMRMSWSKDNKDEINAARKMFEEKIKEGWSAFADKDGCKGEKIKTFDVDTSRIILVPQISGG